MQIFQVQGKVPYFLLCPASVFHPISPWWNLTIDCMAESIYIGHGASLWLSWERICLHCRRPGFIPGLGRSPGEGKGYPLQYSGLENSMNSTVHGVTKSWTQLSISSLKGKNICWMSGEIVSEDVAEVERMCVCVCVPTSVYPHVFGARKVGNHC